MNKAEPSFSDILNKSLAKIKARQQKSQEAIKEILAFKQQQAKPSDYIGFDVYTITIDNGKPYEVKADGIEDLKAELKEAYGESQKTDYAYFDIKVYNGNGEDISESQFITEMIAEIMNDTISEEQQTDSKVYKAEPLNYNMNETKEPSQENIFKEQYESQQNGNIGDFKNWLGSLDKDEIYNFIKWLQAERLSL